LLAIEKQAEAETAERRRKHNELEARGRELRHAKREQTRAERAAEREERIRQKEVSVCFLGLLPMLVTAARRLIATILD